MWKYINYPGITTKSPAFPDLDIVVDIIKPIYFLCSLLSGLPVLMQDTSALYNSIKVICISTWPNTSKYLNL